MARLLFRDISWKFVNINNIILSLIIPKAALKISGLGFSCPTSEDMIMASNL